MVQERLILEADMIRFIQDIAIIMSPHYALLKVEQPLVIVD